MKCTKMTELFVAIVGIWTSLWSGTPAKLDVKPTPVLQRQVSFTVTLGDKTYNLSLIHI